SFIKNASNANKYMAGTAVYRAGDNEFVKYKFNTFHSEITLLVEEISKTP
ncbi:23232_t:CDS:1, partial [Gigaspora rosea]